MDHAEAMDVLRDWEGRRVLVVAFVDPGVALRPIGGRLRCEDDGAVLRGVVEAEGAAPVRIAFPAATFHTAGWVAGQAERGLSVVQGATRIDVFVEE